MFKLQAETINRWSSYTQENEGSTQLNLALVCICSIALVQNTAIAILKLALVFSMPCSSRGTVSPAREFKGCSRGNDSLCLCGATDPDNGTIYFSRFC